MLGHFPLPYPDELFYSICARFSDRMRYPKMRYAITEILGVGARPGVDLPGRIDSFISALPPGHHYTADLVIDNHTLLPFLAPFLTKERVQRLREEMRRSGGGSGGVRAGLSAGRGPLPVHIRFCPDCAQQDRNRYGERYWHRVHQLPGVVVCPDHGVFLENSDVLSSNSSTKGLVFFSADSSIGEVAASPLNPLDGHHSMLLDVARSAAWVLRQKNLASDPELLCMRYRYLLTERGLATHTGRLRRDELEASFRSHYPLGFLEQLGCGLDQNPVANWLPRLVHCSSRLKPPVMHLLLMHFLRCTAEGFFSLSMEDKPFGEGPWTCLNPVCAHYRQAVIREYETVAAHDRRRVWGVFSCECGFVYSRIGPDQAEDDRFRRDRIELHGPLWEAELERLWGDPAVSVNSISDALGVSNYTVYKQAARLGLAFPRPGLDTSAKRNLYRQEWLSTQQEYPGAGITSLRRREPRLYDWLAKYDPEWLNQNTPRLRPEFSCVDWDARDQQLAGDVARSARRLKARPGRPTRITLNMIIKETGCTRSLWDRLCRLPLTARVLEEVLETLEDVYLRRVKWAMDCYLREGRCPSRSQFLRRAGVRQTDGMPKVEGAIELAFQVLRSQGNASPAQDRQISKAEYREAWLLAMSENPEAGTNALRARYGLLAYWLERNDSEWFQAHQPLRRNLGRKDSQGRCVDWHARDQRISALIGPAALQLQRRVGCPRRITASAIANELGLTYPIMSRLDRLPMTAKALEEVVETQEMIVLRRIQWAVGCFREEGICPTRYQFVERVAIRRYAKLPIVKEAIDVALDSLRGHPAGLPEQDDP